MAAVGSLATTPTASAEGALRVLLVEDDEGDAILVRELLADASATSSPAVELRWVRSLREAERALGSAVDCVLLDLDLPDAQDLEGLRRLRECGSAAVLVLTGNTEAHRGVVAVAAGAQDYLIKGQVDGELLSRAIRYAVERRRAEGVARRLYEAELRAQEQARLARGLLPSPLLSDPRLTFLARYEPGGGRMLLGGDFYDVVERPDGTVHVVVGDVCGHGPDEAALGVCLRIAWRTLVLAGTPSSEILGTLQEILVAERYRPALFTTVCMIVVEKGRRALTLYLAGHPPPLVLDEDGERPLPTDHLGVPLGVLADADWKPLEVALHPDWALLLYTDGLIDGHAGPGPERLDVSGLAGLVRDVTGRVPGWRADPDRLMDETIGEVKRLDPGIADDLAALLLLCPG